MTINNVDVSTFKAKLLSKDIQTTDITIYSDWLRKSLSPIYYGKKEQYKSIKLQFLIEDSDEKSCLIDIGNLILQLEKCTLLFDDLDFYYDATIVSKDHSRLVTNGAYILEHPNDKAYLQNVELRSPCAYLSTLTSTISEATQVLSVQGNLSTQAIITITSTLDLGSVILTGFGKDITIKNILANTPVIIDGESGTVTQNGGNKFADADMWDFPILKAGLNTITINPSGISVKVQYKPKFM